MPQRPIRSPVELPDDLFRAELSGALQGMAQWCETYERYCLIERRETADHWWLKADPLLPGACPFELVITANQRFSINVDGELFEDKPISDMDFFVAAANAIASGLADRAVVEGAMTGRKLVVETRIALGDGWNWIGERRLVKQSREPVVRRVHVFLPYRRTVD